ncbi:MAG: hypothetical protein AAB250_03595, partial [Bdellovibrionota bacterium]
MLFSFNSFATQYSDLTPEQQEVVETRLRTFVPAYRIALEIAIYNLRGSIPKNTKSDVVLSKVKLEKFDSIDDLFEQVSQTYKAAGSDVVTFARGEQRIMDLQREVRASELMMWAIFRRPIEYAPDRNAFMDRSLDIVSLSPLTIRLSFLKRSGCGFVLSETASSCN